MLHHQPNGKRSAGLTELLFSLHTVHLVQLHDAARPVSAGAAPPAAETEAAERPRRHEPASLNTGQGGASSPKPNPTQTGGGTTRLTTASSNQHGN